MNAAASISAPSLVLSSYASRLYHRYIYWAGDGHAESV